jgi:hypothetical protein
MNKRRLLKLADLLEADAKNKKGIKFDLATWGAAKEGQEVSHSCGTAACAMGLAVISGAFKRDGLYNGSSDLNSVCPAVGSKDGYGAAMLLFNLEWEEATFLFWGSSYPRRKRKGAVAELYVAKRIRDFVAGKVSAA